MKKGRRSYKKDMQKWENCVQSFFRSNHLTKKWEKHCEEWEKEVDKLPESAFINN